MFKRERAPRLRVSVLGALLISLVFTARATDSPVADAAERSDTAAVRDLLRSGADVNAAQGDGMTALHWAAVNGDEELAGVLLYAGANTESTTRLGAYTPLHLAAREGREAVVATLLERGAAVDAKTSTGVQALHFAAGSGSTGAVNALLAHGADVDALEAGSGITPLMFAAAGGRVPALQALIDAGADLEIMTAVVDFAAREEEDRAASRRRDELMAAQQKAEAQANGTWVEPEEEQERVRPSLGGSRQNAIAAAEAVPKAAEGQGEDPPAAGEDPPAAGEDPAPATPRADRDPLDAQPAAEPPAEAEAAEAASEDEDEEEEEEAQPLSYGQLVGKQGGFTALHFAVRDGHREAVECLIAAGADIDRRAEGDQSTPLVMASINGRYDIAMYLLENGANPNLASEDGVAPLFGTLANRWAPKALYPQPKFLQRQETGYLELMEALLEAGADPDARVNTHIWYASYNFDLLGVDFGGATAFWRAAYATDVPAMKLLVAYGADPAIPTRKPPERRRRGGDDEEEEEDPSGLPPVEVGGPGIPPIVAAAGFGYGRARAGNSHTHAPDSWIPAAAYLIEELGADPNARDHGGFSPLHYAAARGDDELIRYLVEQGADPLVIARTGQTTVDMANGPIQRVQPFLSTIALLEGLGAKNNDNCLSC